MKNIFVYGTLRQGKSRNYILKGLKYKKAILYDFRKLKNENFKFPIIIKEHKSRVYGEIYFDIDEELMKQLDEIEGGRKLYYRILVEVLTIESEKIEAFVYYPNEDLIRNYKNGMNL